MFCSIKDGGLQFKNTPKLPHKMVVVISTITPSLTHLEFTDCLPKWLNGLNIQVVGGLVKDEEVRVAHTHEGEGHTRLLPTR